MAGSKSSTSCPLVFPCMYLSFHSSIQPRSQVQWELQCSYLLYRFRSCTPTLKECLWPWPVLQQATLICVMAGTTTELFERAHDKSNKMSCAPSKDSDQPGHLPSLIRVFAVRLKKLWVLSYPLSSQKRLIRLGGCPGWSESSLGTHAIFLVLSCSNSFFLKKKVLITERIFLPCIFQLLDLFVNEDWSVYLADYGNPKAKYLRVQPHIAINILEKWVSVF